MDTNKLSRREEGVVQSQVVDRLQCGVDGEWREPLGVALALKK